MTRRKKIALMTLPAVALVVLLGSSMAYAHGGLMKTMTEEQKVALEMARELRKEGDDDEAREVLKDAGLNPGMGFRHALRSMTDEEREAMRARHEAVKEAIGNNDFEAFKTATADAPFSEDVTEEMFTKLVEAHELLESGDKEGAFELMRDAGFPGGPGHHRGWGKKHPPEVETN